MSYGTRTDHYPATSKLLHWAVAACVLLTAPVAVTMTRIGSGPTRDALYNLHKSLGALILILMVVRLVNRLAVGALAPEAEIEPWQKTVSGIVHTLFYVLLSPCRSLATSPIPLTGPARPFSACSRCRRSSPRTNRSRRSCSHFTAGSAGL